MDVAIALPNAVPGADGAQLTEWARRAERRGFSSLAANDRFAYASFDRAARLGDGWIAGGIDAAQFAAGAAEVCDSWARHGRAGRPRLVGLIYFSLGPEAEAVAASYLTSYYAWLGEDTATAIASAAATDADEVQAELAAFEAAGCDELVLFPCAVDPAQVDLLAEAAKLEDVGSRGR